LTKEIYHQPTVN